MPYRLIRTIDGKRGGILLISGLHYILIGLTNILTSESRSLDLAFQWLPAHLNANELGWLWIVSGVLQVAASLFPRKCQACESAGFVSAIVTASLWSLIFLISTVFGNPYGARGGVAYGLVAVLMYYVTSWPNPMTIKHTGRDSDAAA